jgi:AcrR family transcriptional regulator
MYTSVQLCDGVDMKVRTDAKRDEIIEIARKTFLDLGYERASMAEIASRLGGSKATLYGYFPSKEALFLAIVSKLAEQYVSPAIQRLEDSAGEDMREALQRFGEQFLEVICDAEAVAAFRVVMSEAAHSDIGESFYETGPRRTIEAVGRYLAGAMDRKQLRRSDPEIAAQHLTALIAHGEPWHQYFLRKTPNPKPVQIKEMVGRALDVFLNGYKP